MDASTTQEFIKNVLLLLVGALVSGVGIFYFQTRIEAKNQRLLARDSAALVRNYEKRVETLELLYKEYVVFVNFYWEELNHINDDQESDDDDKLIPQLEKFRQMSVANTLYLTDDDASEIIKVCESSLHLVLLIFAVADVPKNQQSRINKLVNRTIKDTGFSVTPIRASKINREKTKLELIECAKTLRERINKLYKSASQETQ